MYFLKSVKFVCYLASFLFVIVFLGGGGHLLEEKVCHSLMSCPHCVCQQKLFNLFWFDDLIRNSFSRCTDERCWPGNSDVGSRHLRLHRR